eukprot:gnl/TRDRNA2_/TRDRNA2_148168_c1_seq1.p1 gnl/TRDRNA2_/TRDRNA2_148168_c1~~gnl/TRDRNA2_/TRDRNA2_148168_c1_seq1.p1  ORF type:complete len:102 (-),score=22.59 gnl/TRDRNA2_/TRDRNA2_148168_c1_seq1:146-451(-)
MLAMFAEQRNGNLTDQNLASTAWAFASTSEPAPALLDMVYFLDMIEWHRASPDLELTDFIETSGQMHGGSVMLAQAEGDSSQSISSSLLQACCALSMPQDV